MSLDATVYCDCFERDRLRSKPPGDVGLCVSLDGSLGRVRDAGILAEDLAFDLWLQEEACSHPNGVLIHHRIGNIGLVALLREELSNEAERFPTLLKKVVHNGIHCGDFIPVTQLPTLQQEVFGLRTFQCRKRRSKDFVSHFAQQMSELVEAACEIQKPISF